MEISLNLWKTLSIAMVSPLMATATTIMAMTSPLMAAGSVETPVVITTNKVGVVVMGTLVFNMVNNVVAFVGVS